MRERKSVCKREKERGLRERGREEREVLHRSAFVQDPFSSSMTSFSSLLDSTQRDTLSFAHSILLLEVVRLKYDSDGYQAISCVCFNVQI